MADSSEQERRHTILIVDDALTARSDIDDERRGLDLGAVDYIAKPISPPSWPRGSERISGSKA